MLEISLSLYSVLDVQVDTGVRADGWKALVAPNVANMSDVMPIFILIVILYKVDVLCVVVYLLSHFENEIQDTR